MQSLDYLDKLNDQQRAAVTYCGGPQLVIAGAGSGKTRVLTYKIVHLLYNGYEPYRILALTFTNKAAREMKERIMTLVGAPTASKLWMGTFHSIFARILRRHADRIGFKSDFTIYDSSDSKSLIKSIIKDMQLDDKIYKASVVQAAISMAKNALMSPESYAMDKDLMEADKRARRPLIYAIYKSYRQRCHTAGAMDFDDLLYYTNVMLRDNPDIKEHYREYFKYILVDEYQDTNFAQHVIISELCGNDNKLCVVGDDAQSIYSFRGANIRNILNLKRGFPDLQIFKLEQNYRSTRNIIDAANSLIAKNRQQIPKKVFSKNEKGELIEVIKCFSDYEESAIVANRISQLKMSNHDSYNEFAVLYRTNAQSRILEESLRKRNIPYRIYGGLSFYQRKEIKDAIAYFRLTINPDDDEALKRVINYPTRGIGETTINKVSRAAIDNNISMWQVITNLDVYDIGINAGTVKKLKLFSDMIERFIAANETSLNAYEMSAKIIKETTLLSSLTHDTTPESISKQQNIQELLNGTAQFVEERTEQNDELGIQLTDFLSEVSLATDQDEGDSAEDCVTLMTVHAAKGLEFGNIIVVGVEDDLFPSAMSKSSMAEIEEERRLLYVAITRAKRHCILTYANQRYRNGQTVVSMPSPFLRDIDSMYLKSVTGMDSVSYLTERRRDYTESFHTSPKRNLTKVVSSSKSHEISHSSNPLLHTPDELNVGMTIEHSRFGRGVITAIDTESFDPKITVMFSNVDTKVLLLKFAKFSIV